MTTEAKTQTLRNLVLGQGFRSQQFHRQVVAITYFDFSSPGFWDAAVSLSAVYCTAPAEGRKMETPRLAMRMGAVLEDEACHEDISIGIGKGMY